MTNKKAAIKRLDALDKEAAELRKIIEAPGCKITPCGRYLSAPDDREDYWFVADEVDGCYWTNDDCDNRNLDQGNCFSTKEAAETELEKQKVMQKLRVLADGFVPDWGYDTCNDNPKNYLYYAYRLGTWSVSCSKNTSSGLGCIYFPTREAAQAAIDTLGSELDVLLK